MNNFEFVSNKDLVMYSIRELQNRIDFLQALINTSDSQEVKTKLDGLLRAYYLQWNELNQWLAKNYYVDLDPDEM